MLRPTTVASAFALTFAGSGFADEPKSQNVTPAFTTSVSGGVVTIEANEDSPAIIKVDSGFVVLEDSLNDFFSQEDQLGAIANAIPSQINFNCSDIENISHIFSVYVLQIEADLENTDAVRGLSLSQNELNSAVSACTPR